MLTFPSMWDKIRSMDTLIFDNFQPVVSSHTIEDYEFMNYTLEDMVRVILRNICVTILLFIKKLYFCWFYLLF